MIGFIFTFACRVTDNSTTKTRNPVVKCSNLALCDGQFWCVESYFELSLRSTDVTLFQLKAA